jgi:hypothetical protein
MTISFQGWLIENRACRDAVKWVGNRTLEEAWYHCNREQWMQWLLKKLDLAPKCTCKETSSSNNCPLWGWFKKSSKELRELYSIKQVLTAFDAQL